MVELKIEDFGIDDPTRIGEEWYAFASFYLAIPKKKFGLFGGYEQLGHRINILVCSANIKFKPDDPYVSDNLFSKRMCLTDFQPTRVKSYIDSKVREASNTSSVLAAFAKLEDDFEIED